MQNFRIIFYGSRTRNIALSLSVFVFCAAFSLHFGYSQFGSYDLSPLVDLSWRFVQGQAPGKDYINTLPGIFLLIIKLSSWAGGTWGAMIWSNIFVSLLTLAFLMLVKDPIFWRRRWAVAAPMIVCLPLLYTGHVWHSTVSQLAAVLIFLCHLFNSRNKKGSILQVLACGCFGGCGFFIQGQYRNSNKLFYNSFVYILPV